MLKLVLLKLLLYGNYQNGKEITSKTYKQQWQEWIKSTFSEFNQRLTKLWDCLFKKNDWRKVRTMSLQYLNVPYSSLPLPSSPMVVKTSSLESLVAKESRCLAATAGAQRVRSLSKSPPLQGIELFDLPGSFLQKLHLTQRLLCGHWMTIIGNCLTSPMSKAVLPVEANKRQDK